MTFRADERFSLHAPYPVKHNPKDARQQQKQQQQQQLLINNNLRRNNFIAKRRRWQGNGDFYILITSIVKSRRRLRTVFPETVLKILCERLPV